MWLVLRSFDLCDCEYLDFYSGNVRALEMSLFADCTAFFFCSIEL